MSCVFHRCAQSDREVMAALYRQLKLTGMESPSVLQQYLCIASNTPSPETVKFLCAEMIPHQLSVIGHAAVTVTTKLVSGMLVRDTKFVSPVRVFAIVDPGMVVSAEELLEYIRPYKER